MDDDNGAQGQYQITSEKKNSQHTTQQRELAKQTHTCKNPTSHQATKAIGIFQSHHANNQETRACQRGRRQGRSLKIRVLTQGRCRPGGSTVTCGSTVTNSAMFLRMVTLSNLTLAFLPFRWYIQSTVVRLPSTCAILSSICKSSPFVNAVHS